MNSSEMLKEEYVQLLLQEFIKLPQMYIKFTNGILKELDGVKYAKNEKDQEL